MFRDKEVFRIVDVLVRATLYTIDDLFLVRVEALLRKLIELKDTPVVQDQSESLLVCIEYHHSRNMRSAMSLSTSQVAQHTW